MNDTVESIFADRAFSCILVHGLSQLRVLVETKFCDRTFSDIFGQAHHRPPQNRGRTNEAPTVIQKGRESFHRDMGLRPMRIPPARAGGPCHDEALHAQSVLAKNLGMRKTVRRPRSFASTLRMTRDHRSSAVPLGCASADQSSKWRAEARPTNSACAARRGALARSAFRPITDPDPILRKEFFARRIVLCWRAAHIALRSAALRRGRPR